MLNALEVVTTVVFGVMVGVEFSVAFVINPPCWSPPSPDAAAATTFGNSAAAQIPQRDPDKPRPSISRVRAA
jgi:hypothetical protein